MLIQEMLDEYDKNMDEKTNDLVKGAGLCLLFIYLFIYI
jgi:hypothetical protein